MRPAGPAPMMTRLSFDILPREVTVPVIGVTAAAVRGTGVMPLGAGQGVMPVLAHGASQTLGYPEYFYFFVANTGSPRRLPRDTSCHGESAKSRSSSIRSLREMRNGSGESYRSCDKATIRRRIWQFQIWRTHADVKEVSISLRACEVRGCALQSSADYWDVASAQWQAEGCDTLWRRHSDAVNIAFLSERLPRARVATILKTDMFDESSTAGLAPFLAQARSNRGRR